MSNDQMKQMQDAEFTLRERCMARFQIAYRVPDSEESFQPKSRTQLRYGVTDADAAAGHGHKPGGGEAGAQVQATGPESVGQPGAYWH